MTFVVRPAIYCARHSLGSYNVDISRQLRTVEMFSHDVVHLQLANVPC